jgi:subtilase family serine protease
MAFRALSLFCIVAMTACSGALPHTSGMAPADFTSAGSNPFLSPDNGYYPLTSPGAMRPLCPPVSRVGEMRCHAWMRTDLHPILTSDGIPYGVGYTPSQIQAAYGLDPARGRGQTIAIVDATGDETAASDLAYYRQSAHLPACSIASRCLRIVNEYGQASPLPAENLGWQAEETLDLDAVSATCPKCHIVLVEAYSADTNDLYVGVSTAARLGANIITNSYGTQEFYPAAVAAFNQPGRVIVASAGDYGGGDLYGGGPEMPCSYASVVCVGGTELTHAGNAWSERVWNNLASQLCGSGSSCGGTGSGCSTVVPKPSWQTISGCGMRAEADVSADASPLTPFAIYSSQFRGEFGAAWQAFGGTSLASPLIAGVFGLAQNAGSLHGAEEIWKAHSSLRNVTVGNNIYLPLTGPCASSVHYICYAGKGFNGPTGWGTPKGSNDF